MKTIFGLVFFATGWGPTKGGINSFNFDLCNALGGKSRERSTTIFCVCPGTTTEQEKREADKCNVTLIDVNVDDFNNCSFDDIVSHKIQPNCKRIFWMGHDVITGKQALVCRDRYKDKIYGQAVVFHHMNYAEYYAIGAPEKTAKGEEKVFEQKTIFKGADYAIAVGPKLLKSLEDLMTKVDSNIACKQIIPGLAEIDPIVNQMHRKTILFTGRLEEDNDPIKQYSIPIYAVGKLIKQQDASLQDIELKLYGVESETEIELNQKVNDLKEKAAEYADCTVPVKPLKYTSDRDTLFNEVRQSSISVMPSISEGFGLAGLESISAGVPIVISKNSGLYEFLVSKHLNGYVEAIEVYGGVNIGSVNERDVQATYTCFKKILRDYPLYKKRALDLREEILKLGFTWDQTASDILGILNIVQVSEWAQSLCGLIDSEIQNKYVEELLNIANNCVDAFVEEISSKFGIDKQFVLSLKVDTIFNMPNVIISMLIANKVSLRYNEMNDISKLVCTLIESFLIQASNKLKSIVGYDYEILSSLIVMDEENMGIDVNVDIDEYNILTYNKQEIFYRKIKDVVNDIKIQAVLSEDDKKRLKKYHQELKKKYNLLNFEGLSVMVSSGVQNIPLDKIYASMRLKSESRKIFIEIDAPKEFERVIIKGDPGSGKSTYLKKQLLSACDSNKEYMCIFFKVSELTKWCSDYNKNEFQASVDQYIKYSLENSECFSDEIWDIYNRLRKIGGILYFIDGLDEVQNSDQKRKINQQLINFVEEAKSCRYLLTSRKVGLDEEFFKSMDFTIEEIAPLSTSSIEDYIRKWYKVVGKLPGDGKRDYEKRAERLINSITAENNSKLLNLAGNPLLLSIIVILHYHGINPPNNRTKLYEEITKTLLETWIERRNFERKYSTEYLTNFFSRVAFEIVRNDYNTMTIPETKLKEMYTNYLYERNYVDEEGINSFIQYISDAAGIFPCQGELNGQKLYAFLMHRQITEYYASIALENKINRREIEFSSIINESKWTEVSILMGGYMSLQGEAGQNRANIFIGKLLKAKSKPIEDFKYNILLILKWIANNTFIDGKNLKSLLIDLENILKSSNRYRVVQFCEDIIGALNNDQFKKQFCHFLKELLDLNDYITTRNISVIINRLLDSKELHKSILDEITEQRVNHCLKSLIKGRKDFFMLLRFNGCYHTLFVEYFKKCVNEYYTGELEEEKRIWHSYTNIYACAVVNSDFDIDDIDEWIKFLKKEQETFNNLEISRKYIHMAVLYSIAFDIAIGNEGLKSKLNVLLKSLDEWNCKNLIDSAIELGQKAEESIGNISSTYVDDGIRIYHNREESGHRLTIFSYNNQTESMNRFKIFLDKEFCLDDLERQIDEQKIPLKVSSCLDQLSDIEMDQVRLKTLFDEAYNNGLLLTGKDWQQSLLEKMITHIEVFYQYYDTFKRKKSEFSIRPFNSLKLQGELKIYYKFLTKQLNQISFSEIKQLICLYKKESNETHKNIIYDILYDLLHSESSR